jgi:3-oxoacyl-[acyl-carrier protein] reductase
LRPLKDQAVLITGAGRGIGKRLAIGFAAEGARVGLLARSQAELDLAKLEIEHAGGMALRIRSDVRDYDQMSAAVERMRGVFGGVDVLIAAAAIQGPIGPLVEVKPRAWAETIETNLMGVMHACRAVLRQAARQDRGDRGRRRSLGASALFGLCGVQGRCGALRGNPGGRGARL